MSTFCAIVTCHDAPADPIIECLLAQTRPPTSIYLGLSGTGIIPADLLSNPAATRTLKTRNRDDFGYYKRNTLAAQATEDYLGFFCHDDSYHLSYIERMMEVAEAKQADIVWCRWLDIPRCTFTPCSSTLGNFIISRALFSQLKGFPELEFNAPYKLRDGRTLHIVDHGLRDAVFIDMCKEATTNIEHVPLMLYYHNVPFSPGVPVTSWGRKISSPMSYAQCCHYTKQELQCQAPPIS